MAAEVDAAGRRLKRPGEPDLARVADKDPTELQIRFAAWVEEQTGYKPDLKSIAIGMALRIPFQRSEANRPYIAERSARAAERREARAARAGGRAPRSVGEDRPRRRPEPADNPALDAENEPAETLAPDAPEEQPTDAGADLRAQYDANVAAAETAEAEPAEPAAEKPAAKPRVRVRRSARPAEDRDLVD